MYYLVQPIMGFMLGAVTHLIITAGFLTFNAAGAASEVTVILQMVIGFIAGFRQRLVYELIDRIVQKVAPEETDKSPTSVIPEQ
jgi:ABC-type sulfate transport system permease component